MAQRQSDQDTAPTTREALHRLVDELPKDGLADARLYLEYVCSGRDPLIKKFIDAPEDGEPLTPEEIAAIEEAKAEFARGEVASMDEVKREFGV